MSTFCELPKLPKLPWEPGSFESDSKNWTEEWKPDGEDVCKADNPDHRRNKFKDGETAHLSCHFPRNVGEKGKHPDTRFCAHIETLAESLAHGEGNHLDLYIHGAKISEDSKRRFWNYYTERRRNHPFESIDEVPPAVPHSLEDPAQRIIDMLKNLYQDSYYRAHEDYPLFHALILREVQRLVQSKSVVDLSKDDNYIIRNASKHGNTELVRFLLLQDTVNPAANRNEAIRLASEYGHEDVVKLLLEHSEKDERIDPGAENNEAIRAASDYGHEDVVKILLEHGENDKRIDPAANNNEAIKLVCGKEIGIGGIKWKKLKRNLNVIGLLLKDKRVDPSVEDDLAIRTAADEGAADIVKLLLKDERVNPAAKNNEAFRQAVRYGHEDTVKILLERSKEDKRIDPGANNNEAFRQAVRYGHEDTVKILLERSKEDKRIDPGANNNEAIKLSSELGYTEIVKLLIEHVDDRIDPASNCNEALKRANKEQQFHVVNLLLGDIRVNPFNRVDVMTTLTYPTEQIPRYTQRSI